MYQMIIFLSFLLILAAVLCQVPASLLMPNSFYSYCHPQQYGRIQKVIYTPAEIKSVKRVTYVGAREVERADLILLRKIGNGNFGPVYRAKVWGIPSVRESRLVTAKLLLETADDEEQDQFQSEISVSSTLTHPNVVGLLGVCTKDKPECLLLDAGECIDLLQHIRGLMVSAIESPGLGRPSAVGKAAIDSQWFSNPLALVTEDEHDLLTYADQVCLGMAFLAESQHIHKDLATRNCIITPAMVVKVANFGIAQQLYPESYCDVGSYKSQPLRWMSPEAITHSNFTIENDIWGFGILLWELFTYGEFPYSDMSNAKVESYVCEEQKTLHKPEGCRDEVYDLMCMCWDKRSISRPSFLDLHEQIYKLIFDLEHMPRPS